MFINCICCIPFLNNEWFHFLKRRWCQAVTSPHFMEYEGCCILPQPITPAFWHRPPSLNPYSMSFHVSCCYKLRIDREHSYLFSGSLIPSFNFKSQSNIFCTYCLVVFCPCFHVVCFECYHYHLIQWRNFSRDLR